MPQYRTHNIDSKVTGIQGRHIDDVEPTTGQVLTWNGTDWVPSDPPEGGAVDLNPLLPRNGSRSMTGLLTIDYNNAELRFAESAGGDRTISFYGPTAGATRHLYQLKRSASDGGFALVWADIQGGPPGEYTAFLLRFDAGSKRMLVHADPTQPLGIATKGYVDNAVATLQATIDELKARLATLENGASDA